MRGCISCGVLVTLVGIFLLWRCGKIFQDSFSFWILLSGEGDACERGDRGGGRDSWKGCYEGGLTQSGCDFGRGCCIGVLVANGVGNESRRWWYK